MFVLPEALLARDDHDADLSVNQHSCWKANSSDVYGEKVNVHDDDNSDDSCSFNAGARMELLVALQAGNIVARYAKLHLYMHLPFRNHAVLMLVMKSLRYRGGGDEGRSDDLL